MTRETEDLLQRVLAELLWLLHAERDDYEYRRFRPRPKLKERHREQYATNPRRRMVSQNRAKDWTCSDFAEGNQHRGR